MVGGAVGRAACRQAACHPHGVNHCQNSTRRAAQPAALHVLAGLPHAEAYAMHGHVGLSSPACLSGAPLWNMMPASAM